MTLFGGTSVVTTTRVQQFSAFLLITTLLLASFTMLFIAPATELSAENPPELTVDSLEVSTEIDNSYTTTRILAKLENPHDEPAEAKFEVMIPEKAFVSNFSLNLGNKSYYGEVLTRAEAQKRYGEAVASGKSAGMAEARDMRRFSFSVNLKEQQKAEIGIVYEDFLQREMGWESYTLGLEALSLDNIKDFSLSVELISTLNLTDLLVTED